MFLKLGYIHFRPRGKIDDWPINLGDGISRWKKERTSAA